MANRPILLLRRQSVAGPVAWMGSLPQDAQDASGLLYRRNRFYDPKSGRFTQEDPIGLAGGVNAYSFAEGIHIPTNPCATFQMRAIQGSCVLALSVAALAAAARTGHAQAGADCRAMIGALRLNATQVEAWSDVARCGAPGAAALADALERNRASRDVAFWTRFGDVAWTIRHPALLQAALRVATDSAAAFPARALGLQIALTQHDANANFARGHHPLALEAILAGAVGERTPPGQPCIIPALAWTAPAYAAPLPTDVDARILATADAIGRDRRAPPTLRHMARCIAEELRGHTAAPQHGGHSHRGQSKGGAAACVPRRTAGEWNSGISPSICQTGCDRKATDHPEAVLKFSVSSVLLRFSV